MITNEQLTLIKERTEKATEGNWHVTLDDPYDRTYVLGAFNNVVTIIADIKGDADATFIAQAHEDIPMLVAEVENLKSAMVYACEMISIGESRKANEKLCEALGVPDDYFEEEFE